jgi:hypothetical protein
MSEKTVAVKVNGRSPIKANKAMTEAWGRVQQRPPVSAGRFECDAAIPPEIGRELFAILEPLEWLLPPWCYRCGIYWCSDANNPSAQEGASISASVDYEYRHMSLTFYPGYFDASPTDRRMSVIHDLLHCITSILADYVRDEIKRLIPEDEAPKYRGAVLDELCRRHEAMTQDLARMINERLAWQALCLTSTLLDERLA